jgi:hypothetical protein
MRPGASKATGASHAGAHSTPSAAPCDVDQEALIKTITDRVMAAINGK